MYRHGRFSCIDPRHWGHSEKIGRYPLLYPPPAPLGLGLHSAENLQSARHFHENGSDRDDVEGGRELGWFHDRRRPFLTWGLHGQIQHRGGLWLALLMPYDRDFLHGGGSYDHIGWSAGQWGRYERAEVACLRQDRSSLAGLFGLISANIIRKRGVGGPEICLGMGSYRSLAPESLAVAGAGRYLPNNHLWSNGLGRAEPKLRGE